MKEMKVYFFILFFAMFPILTGCSREGVAPPTYTISGTVDGTAVSGVTINLTGASTSSTTTDADGKFSFTGLGQGTYTLTPSLTDYAFDPTNASVAVSNADITGIGFTAFYTGPSAAYSISGNVSGNVAQNVTITLSGTAGRTTKTDSNGNYNLPDLGDGNYTVTPSYKHCVFNPAASSLTIAGANVPNENFASTCVPISTYAQSYLTGQWRAQELTTGGWLRSVLNVDSAGVVTCQNYEDSTGTNVCPSPLNLVWTMNSDGEVTDNMNMAANRNFMIGIVAGGFLIAQKTTATFTSSDLNNTSFVFHQLKVGSSNEWRYGVGTIGSDGTMTITSEMTPAGAATPSGTVGKLSEDTSGVVLLIGTDSFKGFLSDDKKTLVATKTDGSSYVLMVIQITGKTYTAGNLPNAVFSAYMLAGGSSPAPLWAYWTSIVLNGTMFQNNSQVSNTAYSIEGSVTPLIDAGGAITILGSSYHGQMSYDQDFIIGTQTLNSGNTPFGYGMVVHALK